MQIRAANRMVTDAQGEKTANETLAPKNLFA
jgi:hypothetical protein